MLPENVQANLDRLHPVGGDWGFMYVTEESKKNTCNRCGECCALFMIWASNDELKAYAKEGSGGTALDAQFGLDHWHLVGVEESLTRGVDEEAALQSRSCDMLGEDNLCTCYEKRPPTCRSHPMRVGQTVHKRCAFAGTDDPAKAQPYVKLGEVGVKIDV